MMIFARLSWVVAPAVVIVESATHKVNMDGTIIAVALIAAVPGTLAAWAAKTAATAAANKADEVKDEVQETRQNVTEIKLSVDGFMEKYSLARDAAARAGGVADERQAGLERAAEAAVATAVVTANKAAIDQASAEQRQPVTDQLPPVEQLVNAAVSQSLTDSNMERMADETAKVAQETKRLADAADPTSEKPKP